MESSANGIMWGTALLLAAAASGGLALRWGRAMFIDEGEFGWREAIALVALLILAIFLANAALRSLGVGLPMPAL